MSTFVYIVNVSRALLLRTFAGCFYRWHGSGLLLSRWKVLLLLLCGLSLIAAQVVLILSPHIFPFTTSNLCYLKGAENFYPPQTIFSFISLKMPICKPYDDVAWAISTQIWKDWPELLRTDEDIYNDIGIILSEEFSDLQWELFEFLSTGGFNVRFKMNFTNNFCAVIRFPLPGAVMLPEEKVRNEVLLCNLFWRKPQTKCPFQCPLSFAR